MPNAPRTFTTRRHKAKRMDRRQAAHLRGYDHTWKELRDAYVARHPLCELCEAQGRIQPTAEVDHIIPFHGKDDPLRLQWNNLQSLCKSCHATKTHKDKRN